MKIETESDKDKVINQVNALNMEKVWSVDIKPYKPNRSAAQNRLYWKWLRIMGDDIGYTDKEFHMLMADSYLGYVDIKCMGKTITQLVSTADLLVPAFTAYLKQIEIFAASELGIALPNKDDEYFEAMHGAKR